MLIVNMYDYGHAVDVILQILHANHYFCKIYALHRCKYIHMYMHVHVRVHVHVGWGKVQNGYGINFLCAVINFYNLFVSVFLVCVGRKWRRQRSSPWPLTNRFTTAPTSWIIQVSKCNTLTLFFSSTPSLFLPFSLSLSNLMLLHSFLYR